MEGPDLVYIKQEGIDKVLAQALGSMYRQKPKHPLSFLSSWLQNYCQKHEYITHLDSKDRQLHIRHEEHQLKLKADE